MHYNERLYSIFIYQHDLLPPFFFQLIELNLLITHFVRSQQIVPWFQGMRNTSFTPLKWKIILECVVKLHIHLSCMTVEPHYSPLLNFKARMLKTLQNNFSGMLHISFSADYREAMIFQETGIREPHILDWKRERK